MARAYSAQAVGIDNRLLAMAEYYVIDGVVDTILVYPDGIATATYDLGSTLAKFGEPAQMMVKTYADYYGEGVLPFWLLLYYPERGTLVVFDKHAERVGATIRVCFGSQDSPQLTLSPPDDRRSLEQVKTQYPPELMKPLQEATALTPSGLTQAFALPGSTVCLDSPANQWPLTK